MRTRPGAGPIACSCTIGISAIHGGQAAPHWLQFNQKASPRSGYNSEHNAFQHQQKRLPKQPSYILSGGRHDYAERSSESTPSNTPKKNDCRSSRLISSQAAGTTTQYVAAGLSAPYRHSTHRRHTTTERTTATHRAAWSTHTAHGTHHFAHATFGGHFFHHFLHL